MTDWKSDPDWLVAVSLAAMWIWAYVWGLI